MIGKKLLSWIGAGLLSAAVAIPAIGATVAHKTIHAKHHVLHRTHSAHKKLSAKTVAHKKLASKKASKQTVLASHSAHRVHVIRASHKKLAAHKTHAVRASYGVTSMHSGKTNAIRTAAAAKKNVTVVKSTSSKPKATLLSAGTTVKTK